MDGTGTWVEAGTVGEFEQTDRKQLFAGGRDVGVFRVNGEFFAVSNVCTHANALMVGGLLEGYELECPLHGARFDLRTGRVVTPPASRPLARYEVKVEDGKIFVRV